MSLNLEVVFESESEDLQTYTYNGEEILNMGKVTIFKIKDNAADASIV